MHDQSTGNCCSHKLFVRHKTGKPDSERWRGHYVKLREPRRKVLINARMRTGSTWSDVCLLDMSSRGALAKTAVPPREGTYVEVRRGSHVIVARVVWTEKHRFGMCTQDPIVIDALILDPDGSKSREQRDRAGIQPQSTEMNRRLDPIDRHGKSRLLARSMEFVCIAGAGAMLASSGFSLVRAALAKPLSQVTAVLAPR